jgi:hypothetical protein
MSYTLQGFLLGFCTATDLIVWFLFPRVAKVARIKERERCAGAVEGPCQECANAIRTLGDE